MLPQIERISAAVEPEIKRIFDKITTLLEALSRIAILDGVVAEGTAVSTGTTIFHGLGRQPRGVLVTSAESDLVFTISSTWTAKTLKVFSISTTSKFKLWVY